uniref:Uncharacterized protein n=1 Tax=Dulem virus 230 TaxID=3145707 RepID=A0AAU8B047_9VIRU
MENKKRCLYEVAYSKNGHSFHTFRLLKTFEVAYSSLCDLVKKHREFYALAGCYHPDIEYCIKVVDIAKGQSYFLQSFTVQY